MATVHSINYQKKDLGLLQEFEDRLESTTVH